MKKILLMLLIFLTVLSIFIFIRLITINNKETNEWKTYTYENLTFKYPVDWIAKIIPNNVLSLSPNKNGHHKPAFWIIALDNINNSSFEELHKNAVGAYNNEYNPTNPKILISGLTALYQKDTSCEPNSCDSYSLLYKRKIYIIENIFPLSASNDIEEKMIQRELFKKMLSTFKFN